MNYNPSAFLCIGLSPSRVVYKSSCYHTKQQNKIHRVKRVVAHSRPFIVKCTKEDNKVEHKYLTHQNRWSIGVKYISMTLLCLFVCIQLLYTYVALHTIRKYIFLGLVAWPGMQPGWLAPPLLVLHCLKFGTLVAGAFFVSLLRVFVLWLWVIARYSVPFLTFVYICWELVKPETSNKFSTSCSKTMLPPSRKTLVLYSVEQVAEILSENGLESYSDLFLQHAIDGKVLSHLTEQDLKEMGIHRIGDRKRIMALLDIDE